jgi:hypothetical protein
MRTLYTRTLSIALFFFLLIAATQNSHATKHIINTSNYVFTPSTLNVTLGDTIVWQWINGTHTTTSTTIPAGATPWAANLKVSIQTFTMFQQYWALTTTSVLLMKLPRNDSHLHCCLCEPNGNHFSRRINIVLQGRIRNTVKHQHLYYLPMEKRWWQHRRCY